VQTDGEIPKGAEGKSDDGVVVTFSPEQIREALAAIWRCTSCE
jgi:hypothetical protein